MSDALSHPEPDTERTPVITTNAEPPSTPMPERTLSPTPSSLHYSAHPHILDRIIELSPPCALLAWRQASHDCLAAANRALGSHLVITQVDGGRWLDFHAGGYDSHPYIPNSLSLTTSTSTTSSPPCSRIRIPSSRDRCVAIQIVDPALLLQRSFSGMLFRIAPDDVAWFRTTLSAARQVSITGDIWYGNRTLPYRPLVNLPKERVPRLSLLPATEREIASTHYPSLHPFVAPRVDILARIERGVRYDSAWIGQTTLLPPGSEEVEVRVEMDARQEWNVQRDGRGRPLAYPPSVRSVDITLALRGPRSPDGRVLVFCDVFRILVFKLLRGFRPGIAFSVSGLEDVEVHSAIGKHVHGAELETLLVTLVAGMSNPPLQAAIGTVQAGEPSDEMGRARDALEAYLEFVRPRITVIS